MLHWLARPLLMMLIPRFLPRVIKYIGLIWKLTFDTRVNIVLRSLVPLALVYGIIPFDLASDKLGPLGKADDLILLVLAVFILLKLAPRDIVNEHLGIQPAPNRPEDEDPSNVVDGSSRKLDE